MSAPLAISKHHGLGNDFLVVLDERAGRELTITADDARRWCDRRRGIGADGLIHGARPDAAQMTEGVDVVMHLFNADGSRAEISGNGIRCLAHAIARHRGLTTGVVTALTDAGTRPLRLSPGPDAATVQVAVGMGRPRPGPTVPTPVEELLGVHHATVDMGNPHLVIQVDDPDAIDLTTDGAWLEQQFPNGVNVEYIAADATDRLRLRVWERGAGITEACGSGACAAVHVAHAWGLVGGRAVVQMPGGEAVVTEEADGTITLEGPSVHIADIEITADDDRGGAGSVAGERAAVEA